MQDTDLFISLAEIAGVFVGFGALIAVRSGGAMETHEVNAIRWVVTIAIWVVIVALAPVIVSNYDVADHELWLACSLLALALLVVMIVVYGRAPENRADLLPSSPPRHGPWSWWLLRPPSGCPLPPSSSPSPSWCSVSSRTRSRRSTSRRSGSACSRARSSCSSWSSGRDTQRRRRIVRGGCDRWLERLTRAGDPPA